MSWRVFLLFVLFPLVAGAQAPEGKVYAPGTFDQLEIDGSARIRLVQGDRDEIVVAGDGGSQSAVDLRLVNDRLRIHAPGDWKFWTSERLQITVRVRKLSRLMLSGTGEVHAAGRFRAEQLAISIAGAGLVRFDELDVDQLRFDISGAGDGQLAGRVDELRLSISGKGKVLAEQLRAGVAVVAISGVATTRLWVADQLRVAVAGVGQVDYWGEPVVKRSTSGLASINPLGPKR
jgi:hypothetical protein